MPVTTVYREFGYWFNDPDEYYTTGRYLVYDNHVVEFIKTYNDAVYGGRMTDFHKNHLAQAFQLAAYRDALAVAAALNRIVVLPPSWCWCDYDQTSSVLVECRIEGTVCATWMH